MIKISLPGHPHAPVKLIDTKMIPSSWYGELARSYFRDWYLDTVGRNVGLVRSATVRIEGPERAYTFGVQAVETLTFKVSGGD